jgi:L-ascorbate metabolism protein UlaG (beta-lactamase superfamily)
MAQSSKLPRSRVRRWVRYLWHEWVFETFREIAPAFAVPEPAKWSSRDVTVAWLGHATVLINFFGVKILTDPALFPRIGLRLPGFTLGPKRLTRPALTVSQLPDIDLILLSHAQFDHFDLRTLHRFDGSTRVVTARRTKDLLRWTRFREVTELGWGERVSLQCRQGNIEVTAFRVQHWGARVQRDIHRGYNGYLVRRNDRTIVFAGDTALSDSFAELRAYGKIELAIMSIGCYNPWIRSHCTPEQAVQMANDAGAEFILPLHHQTFRLSIEPFREPIERFVAALAAAPHRIALREIGETFLLPHD